MAILDGLLMFDNAAAITTSRASTNIYDESVARDLGVGDPKLKLSVYFPTTPAGGTSIQVSFQGSADNSTWYDMALSPVVPTANLGQGIVLGIDWPRPSVGQAVPRYVRVNYTVVGTYTSGTVTATMLLDRAAHLYYPAGVTVYN